MWAADLLSVPTLTFKTLHVLVFIAHGRRELVHVNVTRYQINPMDLGESADYLRHHLALVGRTDPLFADDAIARLHKASLGLPRAFNNAATAALIAATTAGKALVDDDCAKKAVAELTRD
jgi:type II secretory pathway predicted ATPase ExeA